MVASASVRQTRIVRRLVALGNRVTCDCCGRTSARFLPYGEPERPYARCVHCGSLERHRLLWPHLQRTLRPGDRVLHFSPEPVVARNIIDQLRVQYTAADLTPSSAWLATDVPIVQADIADQPWADNSFDVVIVSHVLEFVPDDRRAMRELHRVVTDDGVVISQEPHDPSRETTWENVTGPRAEPYVRSYGRDLIDRWREAGFDVQTFYPEARPDGQIFEAREQLPSSGSRDRTADAR